MLHIIIPCHPCQYQCHADLDPTTAAPRLHKVSSSAGRGAPIGTLAGGLLGFDEEEACAAEDEG